MFNTRGPLSSKWMKGNLIMYPQQVYGVEYCVDSTNGNDTYSGFDWGHPKATIAGAITASNAYRAITANANKRNIIYVGGQSYSTDITELPSRTDIVGIGTANLANWTIADEYRAAGVHIYNMYWSIAGATSVISFVSCSSLEIANCQFYATTSNSIAVELTACTKTYIHDSTFFGNLSYEYGIKFTSGSCYGCRIERNRIFAKSAGVLVEDATQCQKGIIWENIIGNRDANEGGQCAIGIDADGAYPPQVIHNWIDAALGVHMQQGFQNANIDNHLVQDGSGAIVVTNS